EGFDAGIRLGQFISPDMVAVRLTPPFSFVVVGSPDYLRGRKRPERIDDLRDPRLPAHASLERVDCALAFYRRQQGCRGHCVWAADRARLPHTPRSGDPGSGTCTGARPARKSANC